MKFSFHTFIFVITTLFIYSNDVAADTINVPADHATVQAAINAAVNGDTVLVAPGTYKQNIEFKGKAVRVTSSHGADVTVLDGRQLDSVVKFIQGEGPDSIIEGFTITNGRAVSGAGIFCDQTSPTIRYNTIRENGTSGIIIDGYGGGIYSADGAPNIHNNLITKNDIFSLFGTSYGGGIFCYGLIVNAQSGPLIRNNEIVENIGGAYGGGIFCTGSGRVEGNVIANNSSHYGGGIYTTGFYEIIGNTIEFNQVHSTTTFGYGGGILAGPDSSLIEGNLVRYNSTLNYGGGIHCTGTIDAKIVNNTIYGNTTDAIESIGGGGIYVGSGSTVTAANNIIWANWAASGPQIFINGNYGPDTLSISYSNVEGGQADVFVAVGSFLNWQDGMINQDPLFVDPLSPHNDQHIYYDSPCRDSGDNSVVVALEDFEGDPRTFNGTVDMGADEFYTHLYATGEMTPGGNIQGKLVGMPGTSPVGLFFSAGVRPTPLPTAWGDFHLQSPWTLVPLIPIPASGVLVLPYTIPANPPAPYDLFSQGLVGLNSDSLTNLFVLEVR